MSYSDCSKQCEPPPIVCNEMVPDEEDCEKITDKNKCMSSYWHKSRVEEGPDRTGPWVVRDHKYQCIYNEDDESCRSINFAGEIEKCP